MSFHLPRGRVMRGGRTLFLGIASLLVVLGASSAVSAQTGPAQDRYAGRDLPATAADLKLDDAVQVDGVAGDLQAGLAGPASRVVIRLSAESGAAAFKKGKDEAKAKQAARAQQDGFLTRLRAIDPNARVLARVQLVLNAVFVDVDGSKLAEVARDPAVVRVARVGSYELDLSETVPYIGAEAVQDAGLDGDGVKVAVLDSGLDYTHRAFGGPGTPDGVRVQQPEHRRAGHVPDGEGRRRVRLRRPHVAQHWAYCPTPTRSTTVRRPATARTSPTSSAAPAVSPRRSTCTRSRSAHPSRPPAPGSR